MLNESLKALCMDPPIIQAIATEVAKHLPTFFWTMLAIQVVVMLLAAGVGAYVGEYLKMRGKHLATRADLEEMPRSPLQLARGELGDKC
jgi:hypothetical protein